MTDAQRIVIDTDPGVDDALALLIALTARELDVRALTIVGGNCAVDQCVRNALGILELIGNRDVPVARGADRPLLLNSVLAGSSVHGLNGLGRATLPAPKGHPTDRHAADTIIEAARSLPDEITLVALGPLTNLALAVSIDPAISNLVRRVVVMGGALRTRGNATEFAECNIYNDPHAAHIVLTAGWPLTLVPLDASRQAMLTTADAADLFGRRRDDPVVKFCCELTADYFTEHVWHPGERTAVLHDPLALLLALDSSLAETETCRVEVRLHGSEIGRTVEVCDGHGIGREIQVAGLVDVDRFRQVFLTRLEAAADARTATTG